MFVQKTDLVSQARTSKKLPNFIWAIILALIFMFCGQFLGGLVTYPLIKSLEKTNFFVENKEIIVLLITLLSFMFTSLVVFFRVSKIEKRKISTIGFYKDKWLKKYAIGFLIGLAMMSVVVLILFILGYIELEKKPIQPVGISAIVSVLIVLIGWIVQGGTEEVLTRGWLMNMLGARYNITFGLILSSVFFGLLHLGNPNISYIAILNIILVGIFFGICVTKTNNLWIACGMHSAWNFAQGNLFGFEVSGINVQVGSLVDLNLVGNDLITGGIFGPEAGLASTFVLACGILIVFILDKKGYFLKNK
ncbi:CPBP family intramembrane metalloprotease [Romboutsia sedimentorum]|uniref:CPBP family intramembrane glutamic endopeptidase n=1 Tax=Romboutsia sedimentorum TaxID=1368474 RepID=UPI0024DE8DDA|nr:CPBP family intramembrane glutamic endopeptidase [Romboutsia sedimentorum]MDK2584493.1 CPBP family intramembrane metalloprotease [Romboutsia sedimentorum]